MKLASPAFTSAQLAGFDTDGRPMLVVVVKATFCWDADGNALALAPDPLVESDHYAGEPARTGLLRAAESGPAKPRVDVVLAGAIAFPSPVETHDVRLEIGSRLRKVVRVHGRRAWLPGVFADLVPSRPRPVIEVPIAWELAYGGSDPDDPTTFEPNNPAGTGIRKRARDLEMQPAPQFEDPDRPVRVWNRRVPPVGFGPVAPFWQPRARLAGTYDERWRRDRAPLLPTDFDPAYFNVAPVDQQLPSFQPGEEVRLDGMTTGGKERFRLPDLAVPVTVATGDALLETRTRVDTIVIEPRERRFSLVARAVVQPQAVRGGDPGGSSR